MRCHLVPLLAVAAVSAAAPVPRLATGNLSVDAIQHSPIGALPDPSYIPAVPLPEDLIRQREAGLWAYEDYIAWGMVEPEEGVWDWSHHEAIYRAVTEAGLVYIPYIWCHFPPTWLRQDPRAALMRETVDGGECYMLSIYDPRTIGWYERFYRALNAQFGDRLREVYACLLGPYGEGNYPLPHVSWVVDVGVCPDARYWCGDRFALPQFQAAMEAAYAEIDKLNLAWGTAFASFADLGFPPAIRAQTVPDFTASGPLERQRWLDFIRWYHGALLDFSARSIDTVVGLFGADRVATKPGGNAGHMNPVSWGTHNPSFAKMAAARRIAMQSADSHGAYWADKWTSTGYAFYGVPYRTEAAGGLDHVSFTARTFTDISCGASRLFTYEIDKHIRAAARDLHLFTGERGRTDVALLAPTTVYYLNGSVAPAIHAGNVVRELFDFDVLDELLVRDGALEAYAVLVVAGCPVVDESCLATVEQWVRNGGILVWSDAGAVRTLRGEPVPWLTVGGGDETVLGAGRIVRCAAADEGLSAAAERAVFSGVTERRPVPMARLDGEHDGVWMTEREHELLLLNRTAEARSRDVVWRGRDLTVELEPWGMAVVPVAESNADPEAHDGLAP